METTTAGRETDEFMKTLVDELQEIATSKTVVGEPINVEGRTLIPVISIMVGFGAGGGGGTGETPSTGQMQTGRGQGTGLGGGGGARVEPIAFIVIEKDRVYMLPTRGGTGIDKILAQAPDLMDKAMDMSQKYMNQRNQQGQQTTEKASSSKSS